MWKIKISLIGLLFLLTPLTAFAAIAFDNAGGVSQTASLSYTMGSVSNGLLIAYIIGDNSDNLTGVTYNGVSMTLEVKLPYTGDRWNYIYYLVNPPSGTHNLVTTGQTFSAIGAVSYSGVNQSSPIDTNYSNFFASFGVTSVATLTTNNANEWLFGTTYAPGACTSSGGSAVRGSDALGICMFDSNATVGTGAGQTVAVNNDNNARVVLGISIEPAGSAPITASPFIKLFLELGSW